MKRTLTIAAGSMLLLLVSCTTLQVPEYTNDATPQDTPNLTAHINYQRNAVSEEDIALPLKEIWRDDYAGLAAGGFAAVNDWLIYAAKNGAVGVIDSKTGEELDNKKLGTACEAAPTLSGKILFQTFEAGRKGLIAYDIARGNEVWSVKERFSKAAPIVTDQLLILQQLDGKLSAWHAQTGEKIWESKKYFDQSFASPAFDANTILAVGLSGSVVALDVSSGVKVWSAEISEPVMADPVIYSGMVFVSTLKGRIICFKLADGKILNEMNDFKPLYHGPSIKDNIVYTASSDGRSEAYDLKNNLVLWTFEGSGPAASSPLVTNQFVLYGTLDRYFYILDRFTGKMLQTQRLERRIRSIPLIHQSKVFLAVEDKSVYAYETAN